MHLLAAASRTNEEVITTNAKLLRLLEDGKARLAQAEHAEALSEIMLKVMAQ